MQRFLPDTRIDLSQTRVMGVLNVTPDSFSDGGRFATRDKAIARGMQMAEEGADLLDVGGESTRPGAQAVSEAEEIDRVVPVIEALHREVDIPISLDTSKPGVMRAGVAAGAEMLNDVRALTEPGALEAAAALQVPVCLMHMQGTPVTMQNKPEYQNVIDDIKSYLEQRAAAAVAAGIRRDQLLLDPGFGFGKTLSHNLQLLSGLGTLVACGYPVLVGLSRKSLLGMILSRAGLGDNGPDSPARIAGSVTLALVAAAKGAHIVRVHDVRETVAALAATAAVEAQDAPGVAS